MKRFGFSLAVGSVAAAMSLASGCCADKEPKKGLSDGCIVNSDCAGELVCIFGRCHSECTDSSDCPDGAGCVKVDDEVSVCQLPDEVECENDRDCPEPLLCGPDGECRNDCQEDSDCSDGQVCSRQQVCAEPGELDGFGDGSTAGAGGSDA